MRRSWSQVYLPVAAVAAVLRCWAAVALAGSPLRNFHLVPGLDMQTLLERGEWGATASPRFTLFSGLSTAGAIRSCNWRAFSLCSAWLPRC